MPESSTNLPTTLLRTSKTKTTEYDLGKQGDFLFTSESAPQTRFIEIANAKDNGGAYQLCWTNMKSNILNVVVNGIYLSNLLFCNAFLLRISIFNLTICINEAS